MRIFYLNDRSADLAFSPVASLKAQGVFAGRFTQKREAFSPVAHHPPPASSRAAERRVAIQKNPPEEPALFYRERLDWIASLRSQ